MNRTIKEALKLAQRPLRSHHKIARSLYATDGAVVSTGEPSSLPEKPQTISMQLRQLADGKRAGVFVANGAKHVSAPKGVSVVPIKEGHIFFNPEVISKSDVLSLTKNGRINEVLGYVQSKKEAFSDAFANGRWPVGVVSRDKNGIEQDSAIVGPGKEKAQAQVFADRAKNGSTVGLEEMEDVVADRMGFADGGVPEEESQEEFLKKELEGSAPQYDPEAGILTGKRAGLMAAGFAPGSGIASAAGKFPTAEGGYEPSLREDIKEHRYGSAFLKALGAAGDVAYAAPVVGTAVGAAMKAPLAAKLVMAAAPIAKAAHEIAPVAKAAEEAAPVVKAAEEVAPVAKAAEETAPALTKTQSQEAMKKLWAEGQGNPQYNNPMHQWNVEEKHKFETAKPVETEKKEIPPNVDPVLNPVGMASRGWEAAHQFLPESGTWEKMKAALIDPRRGAVKPEEMKWAEFDFEPGQTVTRQEIAEKFKKAFPQVSKVTWGLLPEDLKNAERVWTESRDKFENSRSNFLLVADELYNKNPDAWKTTSPRHFINTIEHLIRNDEPIGDFYKNVPQKLHRFIDEFAASHQNMKNASLEAEKARAAAEESGIRVQPASWENLTTPGGEDYHISALRIPHKYDVREIHPSIKDEHQAALTEADAKIAEQEANVKAIKDEHQSSIDNFVNEMKQARLNEMYNDAEIMDTWEKSRKDYHGPGMDRSVEESNAHRDRLMKSIVDKEAEFPYKMAERMGILDKYDEVSRYPEEYLDARSDLSNMRHNRTELDANYQAKSQDLWQSEAPSYGEADYESSSHLPGIRNPLLHMRFKTRSYVDPETGKTLKVLSKEEQQSDAAKQSFFDPILERKKERLREQRDDLQKQIDSAVNPITDKYHDDRQKILDAYEPKIAPLKAAFDSSKKLQSDVDAFNAAYNVIDEQMRPQLTELRNKYNAEFEAVRAPYAKKLQNIMAQINEIPEQTGANYSLMPYVGSDAHIDLGIKDTLQNAIENGFDRIFIPGASEQAKRYTTQLRQQVENIRWEPSSDEKRLDDLRRDYARRVYGRDTSWEDLPRSSQERMDEVIRDRFGALQPGSKKVYAKLPDGGEHYFSVQSTIQNGKPKHIVVDSSVNLAVDKPLSAVFGRELASKIMGDESGNLPMKNYYMGSEGYRSLYEEKLPSRYQTIIRENLGVKPNVYRGTIPLEKRGKTSGQKAEGYWVDITPEMKDAYRRRKEKSGYVFYGYKRGGSVGQKDASFLSKLAYNPCGNRRIREALSLSRKITEG